MGYPTSMSTWEYDLQAKFWEPSSILDHYSQMILVYDMLKKQNSHDRFLKYYEFNSKLTRIEVPKWVDRFQKVYSASSIIHQELNRGTQGIVENKWEVSLILYKLSWIFTLSNWNNYLKSKRLGSQDRFKVSIRSL